MDMEKYDRMLAGSRDAGLLIIRVGLGAAFFYIHGLPKMAAGPELWAKLGGAIGNLGVHFAPAFWGFMAACAECIGGAFLALGLLTRPAAAVMAFNMLVAATMHLAMGQGLGAASHALENLIMFAGFTLIGAGRYSLDHKLFKGRF